MAKKGKSCCKPSRHPDHGKQLPRLNRVSGQVEGIKKMIVERRYCPDILIQLRAARAALLAVESALLEAHLKACVTDAFIEGNAKERFQKIEELKELYRKV